MGLWNYEVTELRKGSEHEYDEWNVFVKPNDQRELAYFGMARKRGLRRNQRMGDSRCTIIVRVVRYICRRNKK